MERLFTSGLIKLLFTTETFALGDQHARPHRGVQLACIKFDGVGFDLMS